MKSASRIVIGCAAAAVTAWWLSELYKVFSLARDAFRLVLP